MDDFAKILQNPDLFGACDGCISDRDPEMRGILWSYLLQTMMCGDVVIRCINSPCKLHTFHIDTEAANTSKVLC